MAFIDHIRACNAHDLSGFRPLAVGEEAVGWVRPHLAAALVKADIGLGFDALGWLRFAPDADDFNSRTAVFARAAALLKARGDIAGLRGEYYPVLSRWGAEPLAKIDRAAVTHFGLQAFGIHVNGLVRDPQTGALSLWVARRCHTRAVAPGKLDNMIAGGQPIGLTLRQNLIKEAAEEAGAPAELAMQARPVGTISYVMEKVEGLKRDTLFIYDLEVPPDFTPRNTDGEVAEFMLWPVEQVAAGVRDGKDWKFNVNLVVIDFLMRHGLLNPDDEPDYLDIARGMRRCVVAG